MATKKQTKKDMSEISKGRKPVPANETPSEKFARLARKRVTKALNDLRLISNLSRYSHTPEQGEKIVGALNEAVSEIESRFAERKSADRPTFEI